MKHLSNFIIVENKELNENCFLLVLKSDEPLEDIKPGNFVNVEVKDIQDRMLRRPISVYDVDYQANTISLVIQKIGKATKKLADIQVNEKISIIYPLGNSFPTDYKKVLLVGGGVGTAPLYYLAKKYNDLGVRPDILIGARTNKQLFLIDKYKQLGNVSISTEDGSLGEKGIVTTNSLINRNYEAVLCCGPTPMMKAVSKIFEKKDIPCYVSLENRMACGIGACLCCVQDTKEKGNVCVCTKGPVFLSKELNW